MCRRSHGGRRAEGHCERTGAAGAGCGQPLQRVAWTTPVPISPTHTAVESARPTPCSHFRVCWLDLALAVHRPRFTSLRHRVTRRSPSAATQPSPTTRHLSLARQPDQLRTALPSAHRPRPLSAHTSSRLRSPCRARSSPFRSVSAAIRSDRNSGSDSVRSTASTSQRDRQKHRWRRWGRAGSMRLGCLKSSRRPCSRAGLTVACRLGFFCCILQGMASSRISPPRAATARTCSSTKPTTTSTCRGASWWTWNPA